MDPSDSLTDHDHDDLTVFLTHAFEGCQSGRFSVEDCVSALAHMIAAVDERNYGDVRSWLQEGAQSCIPKER